MAKIQNKKKLPLLRPILFRIFVRWGLPAVECDERRRITLKYHKMMKHIPFFVLFIVSALLTAACGDDDKTQSGDFGQIQVPDVSQLAQMAEAGAGTSSVSFTTLAAWSASIRDAGAGTPDWISLSPDHGDQAGSYTVEITLQPNTAAEARTAFITITCGTTQIEISITQKASGGDSDEDDNSQGRQPNGRLVRITEYDNGKAEYYMDLAYDDEGRLLSIKGFSYTVFTDPYVAWEFAYDPNNSSKITITETYYDKTPAYGRVWECEGGGFQPANNFATISHATLTDLLDPKATRIYGFEYRSERLTDFYQDYYYDGGLSSQEEIHLVYDNSDNCTQIRWKNSGLTQTFTYDESLSRRSNEYQRLFDGYRGFNPGLCFIYESDMLLSLGMLGWTGDLLPVKVVTAWPNGSPVTETLSYTYNSLDNWQLGEERDGMEITLNSSEGGQYRYVLTFEGI